MLVTSRRASWSTTLQVQARPLGLLSLPESVALLRKHRAELSEQEAEQIAEELGQLPLALHLAGSFLARYHTVTSASYLAKLRRPDLLDHPSLKGRGVETMPTEREPNVARAFALSFDRLNPHDTIDILARQILARAACLAPDEKLPYYLLRATIKVTEDIEARELAVIDALNRLVGLGLLEREEGGELRLHRLLRGYVRSALMDDDAVCAAEQGVMHLASHMQFQMAVMIVGASPLLVHLRYLVRQALDSGREDEQMTTLCCELGHHLWLLGSETEAQSVYHQALDISERVLGPDHPSTDRSLKSLIVLYRVQGNYERAQSLLERALALRERVLGAEHLSTARSLSKLADLHRAQRIYERAQPLYERALVIYKRVLGVECFETRACRTYLLRCRADAHLGPLPSAETREAHIDVVFAQARAARDAALADPASDWRALATAIEARARWAETEDANWQECAAELRALIAQLGVEPDDPDAVS
ncbi:MAG TPA: tetratricopeptide repeat-containing protein [Roseiflexaceae bacterium]|nr:tetratricopeptide repeat-containing protein [Roseiflexaceae bacterium]